MENLKLAVVHIEPCLSFVDDGDDRDEVCEACGWLVDEHGERLTPAAA